MRSAVPETHQDSLICVCYTTLPHALRPRVEALSAVGEGRSATHDELKTDISAERASDSLPSSQPKLAQSTINATSHLRNT